MYGQYSRAGYNGARTVYGFAHIKCCGFWLETPHGTFNFYLNYSINANRFFKFFGDLNQKFKSFQLSFSFSFYHCCLAFGFPPTPLLLEGMDVFHSCSILMELDKFLLSTNWKRYVHFEKGHTGAIFLLMLRQLLGSMSCLIT